MGESIPDFLVEVDALGLDKGTLAAIEAAAERLYAATLLFSIEHMKRHVDAELTKGEDATLRKLSTELVASKQDLAALVSSVRG